MSLKYNYDVLLEMLGGYTYYSKEQVDYIFYDVNKLDPIKTKKLLDQCLESAEIINNKYSKLVSDDEIKETQDNECCKLTDEDHTEIVKQIKKYNEENNLTTFDESVEENNLTTFD
jgi:transglutaminase/protease-like cytokinesis protein 3